LHTSESDGRFRWELWPAAGMIGVHVQLASYALKLEVGRLMVRRDR
jgi:hypothetical protein